MAIFGLMTKQEAEQRAAEAVRLERQGLDKRIEEAVKAAIPEYADWLLRTASAEQFNLPAPEVYDNQADLYRKLSWVLQAVDITASASAVTAFSVARQVAEKEPKDIPNHPFEMLLGRPNPLDSRYEFLYGTVAMYKLTGNAYWWLNRESPDEAPSELWMIPSGMIIPKPDEKMFLEGYLYYPGNGEEMFLQPWEIVHFRRFNPFSHFVGLSAVESIAMTSRGLLGMQEWNTRLFKENNARLPGILTFEQMVADPTWEKIKADTRDAAKKREMMMLRGVGEGGVKWLQNAVSQKEMEFLEGLKAGGKEIMDTLAPGLYTWLSGESTYSNASANRAAFNELTLYPMHVMMGEQITNEVLPVYKKNSPSPERSLVGRFEDVRFADKELRLREQEAFERSHTISEVREEFYGDTPLGDERDDLLPSQVSAQSGGIQEPPPPPVVDNPPKTEEAPDPDEANKAALEDLSKYQRKAVKRVGSRVDFVSEDIPASVMTYIADALPACRTETAVKAVFDNARNQLQPKGNEAAIVLQGLLAALEKA